MNYEHMKAKDLKRKLKQGSYGVIEVSDKKISLIQYGDDGVTGLEVASVTLFERFEYEFVGNLLEEVYDHIGHELVVIGYGKNEVEEYSLECIDCNKVLASWAAIELEDNFESIILEKALEDIRLLQSLVIGKELKNVESILEDINDLSEGAFCGHYNSLYCTLKVDKNNKVVEVLDNVDIIYRGRVLYEQMSIDEILKLK